MATAEESTKLEHASDKKKRMDTAMIRTAVVHADVVHATASKQKLLRP